MRIILFVYLILLGNFCFAGNLSGINTDFFNRFNDEFLPLYIEKALTNNHSLQKANHSVERFRWEIKKAFSYELPELSAIPAYLGVHFPKNDYNIFVKNNSFILPLKISFEPDFMLKNYDKIKKSKADYLAESAKKNNGYLTLLGDVTSGYVNILLYDYLIKKQKDLLENKSDIYKKEDLKLQFGINDKETLNGINSELEANKANYNDLIEKRNTALFGFCNLIGESAENYGEISRGSLEKFEYTDSIPEIISSDLIYLRPDMIEAENKLKSAKIDITIAKKEFFPKFDITGLLVFDTVGLGNFFSWESSFAFLLASATQDLFQGGRKIANLKIKKEKFNELLEEYKEQDLIAAKEINNALNLIKQDDLREKDYKNILELKKNNLNLSEKKLNKGVISELEYLYDKNDLTDSSQTLATNKAARLVDYVTLYKALGGNL